MNTRQISLVKDIVPGAAGSSPRPVAAIGGVYLFTAGSTLWRSDGSEGGTFSLGVQGAKCSARIGEHVYLTSTTSSYENYEPYVTDTRQISRIADVYRGPYSSDSCNYTLFQNAVYFSATDALHGRELWRIP